MRHGEAYVYHGSPDRASTPASMPITPILGAGLQVVAWSCLTRVCRPRSVSLRTNAAGANR